MKFFALIAGLTLLLGGGTATAQERAGTIEFSDGRLVAGNISLTPGGTLKIEAGPAMRVLPLDAVREIRLTPETETMERAWRFKEAGQTAKEYFGDPYPVRHLAVTVTLGDGETVHGHLYTTVLYVTLDDTVQKVILPAKQRGQAGETLKMLVYPARISFGAGAAGSPAVAGLKLSGLAANSEVVAITRGALVRLAAKAAGGPGDFELPSPPGDGCFLAAKSGATIQVGWPKSADEKTATLVRRAMPNSEDFFDDRRILGAYLDTTNAEIYSLVLAVRQGKTTLDEARSQPWRVELYRWKLDDDGRVMLAGQNYFFRGIGGKGEAPPAVVLSEKLWYLQRDGGVWKTRDE